MFGALKCQTDRKFCDHVAPFVVQEGALVFTPPQYAQIQQLLWNSGTWTQTYELPLVSHFSISWFRMIVLLELANRRSPPTVDENDRCENALLPSANTTAAGKLVRISG